MPAEILRVGTLNIHSLGSESLDGVARLLKEANLDIIGLQEAPRVRLEPLAQQVFGKDNYFTIGHDTTALLSRFPISDQTSLGSGVRHCHAQIHLPRLALGVCVVHLDHRREITRMKELEQLLTTIEDASSVLLWIGDLNALTESDYSKQEWTRIENVRILNGWELPHTNITTAMTASSTKIGCKKKNRNNRLGMAGRGLGLTDAYRQNLNNNVTKAPRSHDKVPHQSEKVVTTGPLHTCRFETRIDYIYYDQKSLELMDCQHVDAMRCRLSDHNLVVATFQSK